MKHLLLLPLHVSWRLTVFFLCFIIGVVLARYFNLGSITFFITISVLLLLTGLLVPYWWTVLFLALAGLVLGSLRGAATLADQAAFTPLFGSMVTILGTVADDIDITEDGKRQLRIQVKQVNGKNATGLIWLQLKTAVLPRRNDVVKVRGVLSQGFGNFVATLNGGQLVSVLRPTPGDVPLTVRDWFATKIRQSLKEPQASLGIGYLVGQKSALPGQLYTALQVAGLTHIVVASGYNLTILVRFARRVFAKLSKFSSTLGALLMIISFVAITGLSPSMTRAGLVSLLSLAAWYYGRTFHPIILLIFVAFITVAWRPSYAWGDVGWLLSFCSFLGVIVVAPLLHKYFFGDTPPGAIRQILGETVAAQLVTLPLILLTFGQLSTVSLVANLLILPFIPLAMLLTFIGGLAAIFTPSIATILGEPANWLLGYMINVATVLSEWQWAQIEVGITPVATFICFFIMACFTLILVRRTKYDLRSSNIIV